MAQSGSLTNPIQLGAYDPGNAFYTNRGLSAGHNGADYGTQGATGVGVPAAMGGVVTVVPNSSGFGMSVRVTTTMPNGEIIVATYGHIQGIPSLDGKTVQAGQIIGTVESAATLVSNGGTLGSDFRGPHLHLRLELGGMGGLPLNPYTFNNWGSLPHTVGTDPNGNRITIQTIGTGSSQTSYTCLLDSNGTLIDTLLNVTTVGARLKLPSPAR